MAIDKKIARVGTFYVAVIRGESCFEKNAFEDAENSTRPPRLDFRWKNISGNIRDIEKNFCLFWSCSYGLFYSMEKSVLII